MSATAIRRTSGLTTKVWQLYMMLGVPQWAPKHVMLDRRVAIGLSSAIVLVCVTEGGIA